jgi:leucyl aminopeptidase (aminopeptidase T)
MISIVRTRTLRALRDDITQAQQDAEDARANAEQHRQDAQTASASARRAETALEELRTEHASLTTAAARAAGELQTLRAQALLDTEDRAVLRMLLRTARKTAAAQQQVFVLLKRGQFHSVHASREDAEKAAEREGAHRDGWLTHGTPTELPASEVLWRIQPVPIGTSSQ